MDRYNRGVDAEQPLMVILSGRNHIRIDEYLGQHHARGYGYISMCSAGELEWFLDDAESEMRTKSSLVVLAVKHMGPGAIRKIESFIADHPHWLFEFRSFEFMDELKDCATPRPDKYDNLLIVEPERSPYVNLPRVGIRRRPW